MRRKICGMQNLLRIHLWKLHNTTATIATVCHGNCYERVDMQMRSKENYANENESIYLRQIVITTVFQRCQASRLRDLLDPIEVTKRSRTFRNMRSQSLQIRSTLICKDLCIRRLLHQQETLSST
ncbi:uncharacterized protein LOC117174604 [Belonocnema kinseyi]|uniref:uncharacterized protein LOC117174604 n=1 Tax=Belonocnema kinseyi TaxID=2817044 RepID=UPI00143CC3F5|nr:uncharacterized protein LOC117174604 [Belonocnema kinseyi]